MTELASFQLEKLSLMAAIRMLFTHSAGSGRLEQSFSLGLRMAT